jgi:ribosomal protein S18 acetylase RimI-like enzyme
MRMEATVSIGDRVEESEVVALYAANGWSAAGKPVQLLAALRDSHTLATARRGGALVGLGNAISDGHLVVYFPHLLVHPECQRQGVGRRLMEALLERYRGFHQLMLVADGGAVDFYRSMGFERAGRTTPMWIYAGGEH